MDTPEKPDEARRLCLPAVLGYGVPCLAAAITAAAEAMLLRTVGWSATPPPLRVIAAVNAVIAIAGAAAAGLHWEGRLWHRVVAAFAAGAAGLVCYAVLILSADFFLQLGLHR